MRARAALLADARRLHLQDGPIDLIVEAFGEASAIEAAHGAATRRFATILDELCDELAALRTAADPRRCRVHGAVARRMHEAVAPFAGTTFVTPMAAVAGAVAEAVLAAMTRSARLQRAYVNNGGDIAFHLSPGSEFVVGLIDRPDRPSLYGRSRIGAETSVRGIATSGWRGRSFSLGIADAVTVLADDAPGADAAATIIANAVDLPGHPAIHRLPANLLQPDSDLGERLVTRRVDELRTAEKRHALAAGANCARRLLADGLIRGAALHVQNETMTVAASELALDYA
jgi:ApbE superfamily uncharacterized protein (UPF0280 family)